MKLKLINQKMFWWGVLVALLGVLLGNFLYQNVVAPWPYKDELKSCLSDARALETQNLIDQARNQCFRTYPHFN